jgi:putative oxidoreductase
MANLAYQERIAPTAAVSVDYGGWLLLLARVLLAWDFMLFGMRKFSNPPQIGGLIEKFYHLPSQLVYPTIVLQVIGGLCILLGLQTRFWAANFTWFCLFAPSFFWTDNLHNLTFDYGTAGGFLLLTLFGAGPLSLDARLRGMPDVVARLVPALLTNRIFIDRAMLLARVLIAVPFLADVVKKVVLLQSQQSLFIQNGMPATAVHVVMIIELVCGIALLLGFRARLAALVLLVWTLILGLTINNPHYDFGLFDHFGAAMWANWENRLASTFLKDITVIAALLIFITYGPGRLIWKKEGA